MLEVRALAVDGLAELCAAAAAAARVARFCNCRAFIPEEKESVSVWMCGHGKITRGTTSALKDARVRHVLPQKLNPALCASTEG